MDYTDEINFIGLQLNYFYGLDNWTRRMCADIVGCSVSSQRKYQNNNWFNTLSKEQQEYYQRLLNLKEKEIVRLFPDEYRYYAGETIVKKKREKVEIEQQKDNILFKDLPTHYKYQVAYPNSSGLYMLAQAALNPTNPNEVYFLIKVGQSTNLHNRIKSYNGMNPMCAFVDYIKIPPNQLDAEEQHYHSRFEARGWMRQNGTEWFVVPKEVYVDFLKNGFKTIF